MELIKRIDVFDLDGVIVDTSHRYRNKPDGSIDLEYWFANRNRENIFKDSLLPASEIYKESLADKNVYTIICTARAKHQDDIDFIKCKLGLPNKLIMRPDGNFEHDSKLKKRILTRLFNLRQFKNLPRYFYEDNKLNIEACKNIFTRCFFIESNQGYLK